MQAEKVAQEKTASHKNSLLASLLHPCLWSTGTAWGKKYKINYFSTFEYFV